MHQPAPTCYDTLGIKKDASSDDIKSAYRKLAMQWHPDKNPTETEKAKEKFQSISAAYEILGDDAKRAMYDRLLNVFKNVPFNFYELWNEFKYDPSSFDQFCNSRNQSDFFTRNNRSNNQPPKLSLLEALRTGNITAIKQALSDKPSTHSIFYESHPNPYSNVKINIFEYALYSQRTEIINELLTYAFESDTVNLYMNCILNAINTCIYIISTDVLIALLNKCKQRYANQAPTHDDVVGFKYKLSVLLQKVIKSYLSENRAIPTVLIDILRNEGANLFDWHVVFMLLKQATDAQLGVFISHYGAKRLMNVCVQYGVKNGIDRLRALGHSFEINVEDNSTPYRILTDFKKLKDFSHFSQSDFTVVDIQQVVSLLRTAKIQPTVSDMLYIIEQKNWDYLKTLIKCYIPFSAEEYAQIYHRFLSSFVHYDYALFQEIIVAMRSNRSSILYSHDESGNNFLHTFASRADNYNLRLFNIIHEILLSSEQQYMPEILTECANERNNNGKLPDELTASDLFKPILVSAKHTPRMLSSATLLMLAAIDDNVYEAKQLLTKNHELTYLGREASFRTNSGLKILTAVEIAVVHERSNVLSEIMPYLLPEANVDFVDKLRVIENLLLLAARQGKQEIFIKVLKKLSQKVQLIPAQHYRCHGDFKKTLNSIATRLLRENIISPPFDLFDALRLNGADLYSQWEIPLILAVRCTPAIMRQFADRFGATRLLHAFMRYGIKDGIQKMREMGYKIQSQDEDNLSPFHHLKTYQAIRPGWLSASDFKANEYSKISVEVLFDLILNSSIMPTIEDLNNFIFSDNSDLIGHYLSAVAKNNTALLTEAQCIELFHDYIRYCNGPNNPQKVIEGFWNLYRHIFFSRDSKGNNCLHNFALHRSLDKTKLLSAIELNIIRAYHLHSIDDIYRELLEDRTLEGNVAEELTDDQDSKRRLAEMKTLDISNNKQRSHSYLIYAAMHNDLVGVDRALSRRHDFNYVHREIQYLKTSENAPGGREYFYLNALEIAVYQRQLAIVQRILECKYYLLSPHKYIDEKESHKKTENTLLFAAEFYDPAIFDCLLSAFVDQCQPGENELAYPLTQLPDIKNELTELVKSVAQSRVIQQKDEIICKIRAYLNNDNGYGVKKSRIDQTKSDDNQLITPMESCTLLSPPPQLPPNSNSVPHFATCLTVFHPVTESVTLAAVTTVNIPVVSETDKELSATNRRPR